MNCEAYRALIEEAAGRGAAAGGPLGAHLSTCAACSEFRAGREALAGLLAGLERVGAPDDFEFRLRARMARQRDGERSLLRRLKFAPGLAAAGLAACLLAAAALYSRAPQTGDNSIAEQPATPSAPTLTAASGESGKNVDAAANHERQASKEVAGVEAGGPGHHLSPVTHEKVARRGGPRTRRAHREETFGVKDAAVISDVGRGRQLAAVNTTPSVALRTSPETLRVVLRDERGDTRVLPMRSVTFGAQGPVGGSRTVRASYTDKEGVW